MSRGDDWEYDDWDRRQRPRGRWDDDYDEPPVSYQDAPSGAVTGVAVISFILGGLFLLFSFCLGFFVLIALGPGGGPPQGAGMFASHESILLLRFMAHFVWSIGVIVAGVGLVSRRAWGRALTLVLAAFAGLGGVAIVLEGVLSLVAAGNLGMANHGGTVFAFMVAAVIGLLLVGYAIWSFIVLLNSRHAEEFR